MNSTGNTPYIVTFPPPDSPTSDELALPHEQMIQHVAHLLNIEEEEICRQFPTVRSLLPIDRSPPTPTAVLTPDTMMLAYANSSLNNVDDYKGIISPPTLSYPGTEFEQYTDPTYLLRSRTRVYKFFIPTRYTNTLLRNNNLTNKRSANRTRHTAFIRNRHTRDTDHVAYQTYLPVLVYGTPSRSRTSRIRQ